MRNGLSGSGSSMKLAIFMAVLGLLIAVSACATAGMTISDAKQSSDNSSISLTGKVVTYASTNFFYIEEDSRTTGIMVQMAAHGLTVGMRADVSGTMKTNTSRERYVLATSAVQTAAPNSTGTITPVGMNNNAIGGSDWKVIGTGGQKRNNQLYRSEQHRLACQDLGCVPAD